MTDISAWLESLELERYAEAFVENDVDLRVLPSLTEDDLKELGVSLGHRRLIQQEIAKLQASASDHASQPAGDRPSYEAVDSAPLLQPIEIGRAHV